MISRQQKAKLRAQHKKEISQTTEPFATCSITTSLGVSTAASCVCCAQEIKDLELQLGGTAMETLHEQCSPVQERDILKDWLVYLLSSLPPITHQIYCQLPKVPPCHIIKLTPVTSSPSESRARFSSFRPASTSLLISGTSFS